MTTTYPDAIQIAGIFVQMPLPAKLVFLDSKGQVHPVTTAFRASDVTYPPNTGDTPWLKLDGLADDPMRIILADALLPSPYCTPPTYPDGFTVGQMVDALSGGNGLIIGLNSGDEPRNDGSPISVVVTDPATPGDINVLADVHGVYVDFTKSRVLLTAF